jgi:hypothetical protein
MTAGRPPQRVRISHVEWVADRLSDRDRAIIGTINRLRIATGLQLERLHFTDLSGRSRNVKRWQVLKRLVDWRVLMPLTRRIGGPLHGSAKLVYALDSAGQALAAFDANRQAVAMQVRRPGPPGERFVAHTLAVSELYVRLTEIAARRAFQLTAFDAEPACWVRSGLGGWLKPDAYAVLSSDDYDDALWIEVDRATEHLPTLRRKLVSYLDFMQRGQLGPGGIMPRVLLTVPGEGRLDAVRSLLAHLPAPADRLFHLAQESDAAVYLAQALSGA